MLLEMFKKFPWPMIKSTLQTSVTPTNSRTPAGIKALPTTSLTTSKPWASVLWSVVLAAGTIVCNGRHSVARLTAHS